MARILVKSTTTAFKTFLGLAISVCVLTSVSLVKALATPRPPMVQGRKYRKNKLLIIGLGRVGLQVADLVIEKEAAQVFGTVREPLLKEAKLDFGEDVLRTKSREKIIQVPFDPVVVRKHLFGCGEGNRRNDNVIIAASHVLFTIPLSREPDPLMETVLNDLGEWWELEDDRNNSASNTKSKICCRSKVLGILSTTGVYGNHYGKVVTEQSQLLCEESSNAELYRKFEDDWICLSKDDVVKNEIETADKMSDSRRNRRLRIFRCAGIYDSSRSALHTVYKNLRLETSSKTQRTLSSSVSTTANKTNRIHSIDLARAVLSGMFQEVNDDDEEIRSSEVRIYNIADDLPEARSVVISHAQDLLASIGINQRAFGAEPFTTKAIKTNDNMMVSDQRSSISRQKRRERESKFVCNKRMKEELFPDSGLLFPTYREGLHAIFNDPMTPWRQ